MTCEALLKLLENPPIPANTDDLIVDQDVDDMSFGVGFTQLTTIKPLPKDHWQEIKDVKSWAGEYLRAADARLSGRVKTFAQKRLDQEVQPYFAQYLSS